MDHTSESYSIYSLKAICAYLIILLHCKFPGNAGIVFEVLSRIAVPIFFMISGFYSDPSNKQYIKQHIVGTIKLIACSEIIYFLALYGSYDIITLMYRYCSFTALFKLIFFSVYGVFGAGWYLYAIAGIYILMLFIPPPLYIAPC